MYQFTLIVAGEERGGEESPAMSRGPVSTRQEEVTGMAAGDTAKLLSLVSILGERMHDMAQRQEETDKAVRSILLKMSKLRPSSAFKKKD